MRFVQLLGEDVIRMEYKDKERALVRQKFLEQRPEVMDDGWAVVFVDGKGGAVDLNDILCGHCVHGWDRCTYIGSLDCPPEYDHICTIVGYDSFDAIVDCWGKNYSEDPKDADNDQFIEKEVEPMED